MKTLINRYLPLIVSLVLLAAMSAQAQVNYDKITYIHSDASGTPIAASDEQGDIVWSVDHYPYGAEYSNDANNRAGTLSFAGKAYDEETGLSYFGGRWYNAHVGRFMGIDPVGVDPGDWRTFNRYSYGFNNPYKYVDPDGNFPILAAAAIVGGLNVLGLYLETRYDAANPCSDCVRSSGGIDIGLSAGLAKAGSAISSKLASRNATNVATEGAAPFSKVKFEKPQTKRNGRPEIKTDVTRDDAIQTLKDNGFSAKDFKAQNGGIGTVLTKGDKKITTFPSSTSTKGPTGKVEINGQRKSSIRFGQNLGGGG